MKRLVYIISLMTIFSLSLPLHAVTDKEMEQARVIATQTYLRYANDGSGYLDKLHPSTLAELEKNLKPKEKENIKAFKAIPVPSGYQSWDKQKLVDYWSNTAFSNAGLSAKGKIGKNPTRKKLNNMKVAAPAPAATPAATPAAAAPTTQSGSQAAAPAQASPKTPEATPAAKPAQVEATPADAEANLDSARADIDEARVLAEAALDEDDPQIQKENSNTWIYVVILCILVGVVVALVVFASNVMKKNASPAKWNEADAEEVNLLTKKLKEADKEIEDLERQNSQLRKKVEALTAEIGRLKAPRQPRDSQQPPIQGIPYPKPVNNPTPEPQPLQQSQQSSAMHASEPRQVQQPASANEQQPTAQRNVSAQPSTRTIYLGRANAKKIFIRADRTFNPGNSVFRLDTTDGLAGTFKVVSDPSVIEKVAEFPAEMLSAACVGPELDKTDGLTAIVTDSAGTAIFEGGCWKVMRKAKIHYE